MMLVSGKITSVSKTYPSQDLANHTIPFSITYITAILTICNLIQLILQPWIINYSIWAIFNLASWSIIYYCIMRIFEFFILLCGIGMLWISDYQNFLGLCSNPENKSIFNSNVQIAKRKTNLRLSSSSLTYSLQTPNRMESWHYVHNIMPHLHPIHSLCP